MTVQRLVLGVKAFGGLCKALRRNLTIGDGDGQFVTLTRVAQIKAAFDHAGPPILRARGPHCARVSNSAKIFVAVSGASAASGAKLERT